MVLTAHRCSPCADGGQVFRVDFIPPELQRFTVTSSKHMLPLHFQPSLCYKLKGLETHSGKRSQTNHSALFHLFHPTPTCSERGGHNSITDVIKRHVSKGGSSLLFFFRFYISLTNQTVFGQTCDNFLLGWRSLVLTCEYKWIYSWSFWLCKVIRTINKSKEHIISLWSITVGCFCCKDNWIIPVFPYSSNYNTGQK